VNQNLNLPPGDESIDSGQSYVEFLMILPILLLFVAGILYFGRVLYTRVAVDMAAYDCVRTSAEAMRGGGQAEYQGITAARNTLRGFYLDPTGASVAVLFPGGWGRGNQVQCRVSYGVSLKAVPFVTAMGFPGVHHVRSTTHLRVEEYKSRWHD